MTTKEDAHKYLGKMVKVVLDTDALDLQISPRQGSVIVTGQLMGLGEGGDFEILEADGFVHYCWPALRIELV